jgi:acyl carrier protein
MTTPERVRTVIREIFPRFSEATSLRQQLDSLALFALLPKLEREFDVEIFSIEVNDSNMASVESIADLIDKKLQKPKG